MAHWGTCLHLGASKEIAKEIKNKGNATVCVITRINAVVLIRNAAAVLIDTMTQRQVERLITRELRLVIDRWRYN